jgi:hypothetical protein
MFTNNYKKMEKEMTPYFWIKIIRMISTFVNDKESLKITLTKNDNLKGFTYKLTKKEKKIK